MSSNVLLWVHFFSSCLLTKRFQPCSLFKTCSSARIEHVASCTIELNTGDFSTWNLIATVIFSPKTSTSTLKRHFEISHHAALAILQKTAAMQSSFKGTTTEPTYKAVLSLTLEWIVSDMLPLSTLDSEAPFVISCLS